MATGLGGQRRKRATSKPETEIEFERANIPFKKSKKAPDSIPWEVFYLCVAELESRRSNSGAGEKVNQITS